MFRRLFVTMLVVAAALAATASALADSKPAPSAPVYGQNTNFKPMPCLGAGSWAAGLITTTFSVKSASGKSLKLLNVNVQAGILFVYQPVKDTSLPSYIGLHLVNETLTLPVGTETADFPISLPVIGSDGSVSSVGTTATVMLTATKGNKVTGELGLGDFSCTSPLLPPAGAIPADVSAALKDLIDSASQAGAAGAITTALGDKHGSQSFELLSTLLANATTPETVFQILNAPHMVDYLNALKASFDQLNAEAAAAATAA